MSDPQQGAPGPEIPPIPLAPGAEVPPVPQAPVAPQAPAEVPAADAAPVQVPPVTPVDPPVDTQAPVNPYVQPPANPYLQNTVNPYVQPTQNPFAAPAPAAPPAAPAEAAPQQAEAAPQSPYAAQPDAAAQPQHYAAHEQYAVQPQQYAQQYAQQGAYAPQPQQASAPYAAQPQYPTGIYGGPGYPTTPMGPARMNVLGLVSLIAGGVAGLFGLILSWIPYVGFLFVVIALAGVALGVFGLLAKNRGKGLAIAGLVVSGLSLLVTATISIIMLILITSLTSSLPSIPDASDPDASDRGTPVEISPDATRAQTGDVITFADRSGNDEWQIVVGTPNFNANDEVAAAASYNPKPDVGSQYVVIPVTYTYLGPESDEAYMVLTDLISANNERIVTSFASYPGSIYDAPTLETGETTEVNFVYEVASSEVQGLTFSLGSLWGDLVYVALD